MEDKNVSPELEKRFKGSNFNDFISITNFYLVTYYRKGLLTRKTITLRKGFYDIPDLNGRLSKLTCCNFRML